MDDLETTKKMSGLADRYIADGERDISLEQLEEIMEKETRFEEADDKILSDFK